jgi:DNA-binding winged helix-turn-helix (wHTH) protein
VDVVFVRWPQEAERRDRLAIAQVPRLLLLDVDATPPEPLDCMEDWVRLPADDGDIRARVTAIARRHALHAEPLPALDDDGVLRYGSRWVPLPPVEARLVDALLSRFGSVVSRETLARAGWPEGAPGRNALDVHVLRLRRRIAPVALAIRTVRSRGYLLEPAEWTDLSRTESRQMAARQA